MFEYNKRKVGESPTMDWFKDDMTDIIDNHLRDENGPSCPGQPKKDWGLYRLERKEHSDEFPDIIYVFYNRKKKQFGFEASSLDDAGVKADVIRLME